MKRNILIFLLILTWGSSASATPVVPNTTYDVVVVEGGTGFSLFQTASFDGIDETFALSPGGFVTVSESQSYLGSGFFEIKIDLLADSDLFGVGGGDGNGFFNIGGFSNPLDFTGFFDFVSAQLSYFRPDASLIETGTFPNVYNPSPWDGFFLGSGGAAGFTEAADEDVYGISLSLQVRAVPEPSSMLLVGFGLICLSGARRRLGIRWNPI